MKYIEAFLLTVSGTFIVVTAFDVTVNGIFEPASVCVAHLDAGAGSILFLVRLALAAVTILALVISSFFPQTNSQRTIRLSACVCIVALFWYSAVGVQRYADQYDEEAFMNLVHRHHQGQSFTLEDIRSAVGDPIVDQSFQSGTSSRHVWLYTYMPSCGFGWNKRIVYFDDRGRVTGFNTMDEP